MNPTWTAVLTAWATALTAARRSPQTVGLRTYHLTRLAVWAGDRDPWSLTLDDLLTWTGSHTWSRETARSVRSSLRQFWHWGVLTGRCSVAVADGLPVIPPQPPSPRPASPDVVERARRGATDRVRLMIRLADDLGMRRGEVAVVRVPDDLHQDLAGWSLHVHGKGSRDRVVPLPDDLARWLRRLPAGWAFPGRDGGHLSPRWVGRLVSTALGGGTTMHQLRHRAATEWHDATRDLRLVQDLLGHASVATTQRYVRVRDDAKRAAVAARATTAA